MIRGLSLQMRSWTSGAAHSIFAGAVQRRNGMKPFLVLYATQEGQTKRIADHVGARLRENGLSCDVINIKQLPADFSLKNYGPVILAASVHIGKHQREMARFVRQNRQNLDQVRTAFLSVSLSQAGAQDSNAPWERRQQAAADVNRMVTGFLAKTHWQPWRAEPVAGALMYSKYNPFMRFIMKRIAQRAGASTDTSHDYEFTDWAALDRFLNDFVADTHKTEETKTEISPSKCG